MKNTNQKKDNLIIVALKGFIVGSTMLVPGVSGGSMAMILGIYDRLIASISSFFKNKKINIIFLTVFSACAVLGILLFSKPMTFLLENFNLPTLYFFLGAVAGGLPLIFKEAKVKKLNYKVIIYIIIGLVVMIAFAIIPEGLFVPDTSNYLLAFILLTIAGLISAVALVLPGISVSYMLLVLGLYQTTIKALGEFDIKFLLPLALGLIVGIIATTKLLEYLLNKFPQPSYLIILGFIIGSMAGVFPGFPKLSDMLICFITLILGFFSIYLLSLKNSKE